MSSDYADDLAWIHHEGFSEFAESAAEALIELLHRHRFTSGTVVDAGCGSGIVARELGRAGFDVHGFDASPSMIALARETAPRATFEIADAAHAVIPRCIAVFAIGEVLNYAKLDGVRLFVSRLAESLDRGGLLVFDVAESGAYPEREERRVGGDDWSVVIVKESDGTTLTRRVIMFRRVDDTIRRSEEIHTLDLYDRDVLLGILESSGFSVQLRRSYGTRRLPAGHAVYVATRADAAGKQGGRKRRREQ